MADDVNFLSDDRKKKPQQSDQSIEYTQVKNDEEAVKTPAFENIATQTNAVKSSFLEWRTERKKKRDAERKQADAEAARTKIEQEQERLSQHQQEEDRRVQQQREKERIAQERAVEAERREQMRVQQQRQRQRSQSVPAPVQQRVEPTPAAQPKSAPLESQPKTARIVSVMPAEKYAKQLSVPTPLIAEEAPSEESASVNLVSEVLLQQLRSQNRLRDLAVVAGLMCVFIMTVYSALNIYAQKLHNDTHDLVTQIEILDNDIASQESIKNSAEAEYAELKALKDVLDSHIEWNPFFEYIEQWTLPTVSYTSIVGSALTGHFTLAALTTDIRYVTAQVDTLRQAHGIVSVSTTSASQVSGTDSTQQTNAQKAVVQFTLTVQFDTSLFHPHKD